MPLVEVNSVSKSYARRAGLHSQRQTVVENVSLAIEAGETLGLVDDHLVNCPFKQGGQGGPGAVRGIAVVPVVAPSGRSST